MKLTIIGAGGVRTPLVIQSLLNAGAALPLREVSLMDVDGERLELMRIATTPRLERQPAHFALSWTTDARRAIAGADFVITTFRAGDMPSRQIDERVPLRYGVLGQETTGPGGLAMGLRTIPVLLDYVRLLRELAPGAWLLNFTNPAGMVTEAVTRAAGYEKAVGICDNPANMVRFAARLSGVPPQRIFPEYYGLNHLGWLRALFLDGADVAPALLAGLRAAGSVPGLPFDFGLIEALGAFPNEYLYYYYHPRESVENILRSGQSRADQILPLNERLYAGLRRVRAEEAGPESIEPLYADYLRARSATYMSLETGARAHELGAGETVAVAAEGYAAVAVDLILALTGRGGAATPILNVPNRGAIPGMAADDVVEVTCYAGNGVIRPLAMGAIPDHALGLMKQVKACERLIIQAALENSYSLALQAFALHPLVPSFRVAKAILDDYLREHGDYFPRLR